MTSFTLSLAGHAPLTGALDLQPRLWMHKEDAQAPITTWGGGIRPCAPCPAVWVLKDDQHAEFGRQWQYYLRAINYNMTAENVMLLLDYRLAFANRTGLRNPEDPRADYITGQNLSQDPPQLDKVRTTSRSVVTGVIAGDRLLVTTFDSRKPPPIKQGKVYPARVEDAKLDDYVFNPKDHPWMFLTANLVNGAGEVVQFPRGAVYAWTADNTPRSWLPLVSNHGFGDVLYPLANLVEVGGVVPSPYRSN